MQHNKVTALVDITLERHLLLLGCIGLGPQPVLDIDRPVGDGRLAAHSLDEAGAHTGALVTKRRAEVRSAQAVELRLHSLDVLIVLPVNSRVVGERLHLGVCERVQRKLVTRRHHLLVHIGEVGACVEKGSADGEEGDLDVLLTDDFEHFLSKVWHAVVDGESKAVGALARENQVTRLVLGGNAKPGGNRGDNLNDGQRDRISTVETLQSKANDARVVDVEVVHGDVHVSVLGVARNLSRVPRLGERCDGRVAASVVLLEGDAELRVSGVSNVEVRALVLVKVAAGARDLGVEGVVRVGRSNGKLSAAVVERHALITAVPVAHGVGVGVRELVNNKRSGSRVAGSSNGGARARATLRRWDNVLARLAAVKGHGTEGYSTGEPREEDSGKLLSVERREFREGNVVQLLGAIKCPAKLGRRLIGRLSVYRIAVVGRVELNGESSPTRSLDPQRDTAILVLCVHAGELTVKVGATAGFGDNLHAVGRRLSNSDGLDSAVRRGGVIERIVEEESQAGLRNPVVDEQRLASTRGDH